MHLPNIAALLHGNQFFSGGLILGLIGGLVASIKRPLETLWQRLIGLCFVHVEILNSDPLYDDIQRWLAKLPQSRRFRSLTANLSQTYRDDAGSPFHNNYIESERTKRKKDVLYSPSPGTHFVMFKGHLIWVSRFRDVSSNTNSTVYKETLHIRLFCLSATKAREIIGEAALMGKEEDSKKVCIYGVARFGDGWTPLARQDPRPSSSVILPEGQLESLLQDCKEFTQSKRWYHDMGIPYRRGYLLHGIPGSGKTSSLLAIAGELGLDIYVLHVGNDSLNDTSLQGLVNTVPEESVLLIEDVDSIFPDKKASDSKTESSVETSVDDAMKNWQPRSGVSFSGLLNAIDGVCAADGRILCMSTNHVGKLKEALIRPGRVDVKIEFTYATVSQASRLFSRFFPESSEEQRSQFGSRVNGEDYSMARIQQHLLLHKNNMQDALDREFPGEPVPDPEPEPPKAPFMNPFFGPNIPVGPIVAMTGD